MLESKEQEAWRVLRLQSELVDGTDRLLKLGAAFTVFCGARFAPGSPHYQQAQILGGATGSARGTGDHWRWARHYGRG